MKKYILYILTFLFCLNFGFSQSLPENKRKLNSTIHVSKYALLLDKNTKEKIKPILSPKTGMPEIKVYTKATMYYTMYLESPKENKDYQSLLKSYELSPSYSEMYFELAKYYELTGDKSMKKKFCKKMKKTILTPDLNEYAYNTLMSVEKNGILVTYGEKDTYPIWILQTLKGIRKDVKILNYDLLVNNEYRNKITKEFGLIFKSEYDSNIKILHDIALNNKEKPIYYSLTVSHLFLKQFKNQLYTTGLALKFSTSKINNADIIKTNWEKKFKKKYVIQPQNASNKINANYILPLFQLAKYYKANRIKEELEEVKGILLILGKNIGKEEKIKTLINKI